MAEDKGRKVVVSALQFACTDDVSTNVATAERSSSYLIVIAYNQNPYLNLINFLNLVTRVCKFISFPRSKFSFLPFASSHYHLHLEYNCTGNFDFTVAKSMFISYKTTYLPVQSNLRFFLLT